MKLMEMLEKYSTNSLHAQVVKNISMMLFEETNKKVREMPEKYRKYLEAASLLHDIGYYIDSKGHNKHSMNIVIEHGLEGFDITEEKMIACICRYHRGSLPDKEEHEIYNTLDKKERKIVKRLAGILRIADGLDKGHFNIIENITINNDIENNIVEILIKTKGNDFHPDISDAIRKRDLYEIAFKCQCVLKFV